MHRHDPIPMKSIQSTPSVRSLVLLGAFALVSSASVHAATLYWGGGTVTPGTSIDTTGATNSNFTGTWDTTTSNWNTVTNSASGYTTWTDGSVFGYKSSQGAAGAGATITLNGDFSAAGFNLSYPTGSSSQALSFVGGTSSTNHTITIADDGVISVSTPNANNRLIFGQAGLVSGKGAAILAGHNFSFNGLTAAGAYSTAGGAMTIQSASTISGTAKINSGYLNVGAISGAASVGSLANITTFNVLSNNAVLNIVQGGSVVPVSASADIRLASGQLGIGAVANGTAASVTVNSVILEGSGRILTDSRSFQASTVSSTINLTSGFSRGDNGKGVLIAYNSTEADGGLGTATGVNITGHGIAANTAFIAYGLNQGKGYNVVTGLDTGTSASARFMATDGSGKLGVVNSSAGDTTLANWDTSYGSTNDIHFDTSSASSYLTGTLDANTAIRSLAIGGSTSGAAGTLGLGGFTLKADAIGLAVTNNVTFTLGTNDGNRGIVTANGTSGGDLYFIHERSSNAASGSSFTVNSVIADNGGAVNAIFGGASANFTVNSASTHTGTTYINGGIVTMSATGSLLSTKEINIASGAQFSVTSANTTYGGGSVAQKIAGGGGVDGVANIIATTRTITIGANGTIAPGDTGANENLSFSFTTGKLSFVSGATVKLDFGAVASSDKISFAGTAGDWLSGSGNAILDVTSGDGFAYGVAYTALYNVSTDSFAFGTVKLNGTTLTPADYTWLDAGSYYTITFAAIPEPSASVALVGLGILGFAALRRRRHA